MQHAQALILAEDALNALTPHCERILIAGSIRRLKPEVGDVEIVAIPKLIPAGLFGDEQAVDPEFCAVVNRWTKVKGQPTGKHTKRRLPGGITLDLFLATPENWGLQLAIRTGSADYSHHILATSWTRLGYTSRGGILYRDGRPTYIREEIDLFTLLVLPWVEPWDREV